MIKRKKNSSPRAWQRMLSGRRLDLLDPSPLDVEITDIALGLSRVTRWNGQTKGVQPYSVAEHSLLVERLFSESTPQKQIKWRLAALLHDAPEYVIGDVVKLIKKSDRLAAYIEATQLAGFSQAEARRFFGNFRKIPKIKIQPCTADNARRKFLDKFNNVFN